jgi:NADH dehydrogenase (ubiquinone) Fe-S protein 3
MINHTFLDQYLPKSCYTISNNEKDFSVFVPNNELINTVIFLKNHTLCQFKVLSDITAVDWLGRNTLKVDSNKLTTFNTDLRVSRILSLDSRFCLVYNLLSVRYGTRLLLKTFVDKSLMIETLTTFYSSGNWWEREVWDMFGIVFLNHPDHRRLLTDYGFRGFPLRKDFPLSGYTETRYDENSKRVVLDSIDLSQEFRYFDLGSPWENT